MEKPIKFNKDGTGDLFVILSQQFPCVSLPKTFRLLTEGEVIYGPKLNYWIAAEPRLKSLGCFSAYPCIKHIT